MFHVTLYELISYRHCLCRMTTKEEDQVEEDPESNVNTDRRDPPLVYTDLLKALGMLYVYTDFLYFDDIFVEKIKKPKVK